MPRRSPPPTRPQAPQLTAEQIRSGIGRLNKRIEDLERFDPTQVKTRWPPEVKALETAIEETLAAVFGDGTDQFNRYIRATSLDHGPVSMQIDLSGRGGHDSGFDPEAQRYLAEGKAEALLLLRQAVRGLEESLPERENVQVAGAGAVRRGQVTRNRKIFIVHGHDEAREMVARFVVRLGFEPIILHEQASQGRTIIEKVELHGDVQFAIVILTPDDEGRAKGGVLQPRARQNVVLELGYFLGRLGRHNVCALKRGDLEIPTDFAGVVYQPLEGDWRRMLGQELQAAGFEIDWNAVMRQP